MAEIKNGAAMMIKGTSSSGVLAEMPGKVVDNMISILWFEVSGLTRSHPFSESPRRPFIRGAENVRLREHNAKFLCYGKVLNR